jgi:hypothetical protein
MIFFNDVEVTVNGTGILANSASISSQNQIAPVRVLGIKGIAFQAPSGPIQSEFSISYTPETDNEPNYNIVKALQAYGGTGGNQFQNKAVIVEVAGISGYCYLNSYSLSVKPNTPAEASVGFTAYKKVTGSLRRKGDYPHTAVTYNAQNSDRLAHGWTTYFTTEAETRTNQIYDFSYEFSINWQTSHALKETAPYSVRLMSAAETINITRDIESDVVWSSLTPYSGTAATGVLFPNKKPGDATTINLHSVGLLCDQTDGHKLSFNTSGAVVTQVNANVAMDDMVKNSITIKNYY